MEKKQITPEMLTMLKAPLPNEAISQHPTKTYLSSIKAVFVTERLSDVFGCGSWHIKSEVIEKSTNGMVVVKTCLTIPEYGVELESYGGNDNGGEGNKNFDLGDAYKGAVTDALTKIGSWLYIGIDVFKGKSDRPKTTPQQTTTGTNDLPWLNQNTQQWTDAVKFLKTGGLITDIKKKCKISKANEEKLISEAI